MVQIREYEAYEIFSRPDVVKRLRFLTNGGWGRHGIGSALLHDLSCKRDGIYILAWHLGQIVGWAMICKRFPIGASPWQVGCYVARPHRGRGIASKLMKRVKSSAARNEIPKVVAAPWNRAGQALYAKHGFALASYWV